jgi:membrane fusion protein, multidrug efflux system
MSDLDLKDGNPGGEVPRLAYRDGKAHDDASDDASDGGEDTIDPDKGSDPAPQAGNFLRKHPVVVAIVAVAAIAAIAGGIIWWLHARNYQSTDDAFIDARNVSISSQVTGVITGVPVTDNQPVEAGGLLVQIDQRDYEAAVAQAEAQVAQADAAVANLDAQIDAQKARIDQAKKQVEQTQAALTFAHQENDRAQDLVRRGAGTQQQSQQTTSNFTQAEANVASAQANEVASEKQIPVLETQRQNASAQLAQMQAALKLKQINLTRTRIAASEPGRATNISAALGTLAQPGTVLMIFVPEQKWVTANFKETQLTLMRPGQPVDISIDAYPGHIFGGHVDSIQPGSGAAFSLLPPQNATGNYVKVVQRVPVKIVFDQPPDVYLGPGMSVVPTVKVR